jgi:hypothetical protein
LVTVVLLGIALSPAGAQELGTAVLNGDVTDPSGAQVSGATVTVQNAATSAIRTSKTSHAGLFVLNNLAPGDYWVNVQADGFALFKTQVRMEVGQQQDLRVALRVDVAKTAVEITDSAATSVNTVSSVVDGVVTSSQIDNLPLNGRNFLELALLLPGNAPAPNFDPTKTNTVVISSAGQLGRGSSVTIDGTDNNDDAVGGMLLNLPEDSVQEFQIATNRFSAETGRSGSAVANVVTKSGSNSLHGSASVYERDQALQALPTLFNPAETQGETPPFSRQQYSGTLGGPIVRDKAWLFGAFEYRNELSGVLAGTRNVADQSVTESFARAPLNDALGTLRGDWQVSNRDQLTLRYSIEQIEATDSSVVDTSLGSASQRQDLVNHFQNLLGSWTRVLSPTLLNRASFSYNKFWNNTTPVTPGPQLDFPSLTDGASYRMPQQTWQTRLQWTDGLDWTHGRHNLRFGGEVQRVMDKFFLGVFQGGRIEFVQNFANQDRNGDGVINDQDLLFAATIRSDHPTQALVIPDANNNYIAGYVQDDWHVHPQFTLNLGLRYELDTDANNVGHYNQINPILLPLQGTRHKDTNNFGPRVGFNLASKSGLLSLHGGYGIYYDRVTLEVLSLERGLDGRALPIDVRAGNAIQDQNGNFVYLDPNGNFIPGVSPTYSNPFIGFIFPGAGAAEGMDVINNHLQNPMVQQFNLGVRWQFAHDWILKADGIHNLGTHFIIGVPVGAVFNPVVGGPEGVTELRSAVNTHYDALWLSVDKRFAHRFQFHSAYTLSKALNYANDDQIPFAYPPIDPTNLRKEYGPTPNDQRSRFVTSAIANLRWGIQVAPLWTWTSGVPMDILLGDGSGSRVPELSRNAGGRFFHSATQLNAYITQLNAAGAVNGSLGTPLPLVDSNARFNDSFNSFDLRLSKDIRIREGMNLQLLGEVFNLLNKTNILGASTTNYSGFFNALVPDQNDPTHSSAFGKPVSTAGGIFGSGGPRAFQLAAKFTF